MPRRSATMPPLVPSLFRTLALISLLWSGPAARAWSAAPEERASTPRHVILVITDDQGYGDVAVHGNRMISTPHLDRLHGESVRLTDFHVDPTCAPTRSALMSGRYSTRTGVWHTIMGRSLMATEEVTVAEVLRAGGYRTAMFGKWHLGDNYPCRPQDQGFDECFYHGGGGVTQTPDHFGNDYFDDTYFRAGRPEKVEGYCTDVWFREAIRFVERCQASGQRSFTYLATNAPHGPYLVAESYSKPYVDEGVARTQAAFYGMITNIDENMGRLLARLEALGIAEETALLFMTDNGTAAGYRAARRGGSARGGASTWTGFNAGMRGTKGSEYDGGHRVPCFVRWPGGGLGGGRDVPRVSAHVDVLPTLAELCGVRVPGRATLDGRSLLPLLRGEAEDWPDRVLLVHSQRIEHPRKWRKCSVMTDRYRFVNGKELYDIRADPGQQRDIASERPEVAARLRQAYEEWWTSLATGFERYVRIHLGSDAENPSSLTCHDWHTGDGGVPWNQGHIRRGLIANGFWAVRVERPGRYEIRLRRWPSSAEGPIEAKHARLRIGKVEAETEVEPSATSVAFRVELPAGDARLQSWLTLPDGRSRGAYFVEVERLGAE